MVDLLQDRIAYGLGRAARAVGQPADAFRPRGPERPLNLENRFLRLPAAFHVGPSFTAPDRHGGAVRQGLFDSAYTLAGDYLMQGNDVYFVASQPRLMPVVCIKTNRIVGLERPRAADAVGINQYNGTNAPALELLNEWPASMFGLRGAGVPHARLPGDVAQSGWTVLLPASIPVNIETNDILFDELGRRGVVSGVEESALGWRLHVQEARV